MLVEFLNRVVELAHEAARPQFLKAAEEPPHIYHVLQPRSGELTRQRAEPPCREHQASDLATIVAFAQTENAAVWYSRELVVALLDDGDRRDHVGLRLKLSPSFKTLQRLAGDGYGTGQAVVWHTQKDFVSLLRIALAGCLATASNLLGIVRQLKFRQLAEAQGVLQHGKASVGKQIASQLEGAEGVPEQVVLEVPVFANLLLPSQQVLCAVDIDTALEKLALIPLPGTLETALQQAEAIIARRLRDELEERSVPVYYGQA